MTAKRMSAAVLLSLMVVPELAHGGCLGLFHHRRHRLFDPCGTGCAMSAPPMAGCAAPLLPQAVFAPPAVDCCIPMQPVVETCLVPQTCTTYRDIPQTCYRQEAVCQTVPVTTTRQVTVDEGCYQQIWVPKLVTKSVPQTVYQQQVAYRTVPYQTVQRVPVTETRMVPQQRMRYMPQPMPMPAPITPGCCGGAGVMPSGIPMLGPATLGPIVPNEEYITPPPSGGSTVPALPPAGLSNPAMYNPPSAMSPMMPVPAAQDAANASGSVDGEWRTIEKKVSQFEQDFGYRPFGSKVRQASHTTGGGRW